MKSRKNIKRLVDGILYISVDTETAIRLQNRGIKLKQIDSLKSIFVKEIDYKLSILEDNLTSDILYDINTKIEEYSSEYHKAWNKKDDLLSAENEEEQYYKEKIRTLEEVVDIIYDNLRKKEEK